MGTRGAGTRGASARRAPQRRKQSHGATYSVVLMTVMALVGVAVLAAQAARAAPTVDRTGQGTKAAAQATASATANPAGGGAANPNALPGNSGSGTRVVYSVGGQRVWLVGKDGNTVERTFQVVSGPAAASPGSYSVTRKEPGTTGSDGTPVQYVVLFSPRGSNTTFGFDAVANVTGMPPKPSSHTSAVRMAQLDAQALFNFVSVGTNITVIN